MVDIQIADRRWSYVGLAAMVLGLGVLVVANFQQELGVPLDVPIGSIGNSVIVLGVALYLLQRRADQDREQGDPPASS